MGRLDRLAAAAWILLAAGCLRPPPPAPQEPAAAASERGPMDLGRLYAPGEVRAFRIVQGGITLGYSFGRYAGTDDEGRHVFETKVEIRVPARPPARSEGRIVYDARGHVVEGYERSDAAEIRFRREGDSLVLESGRQRETVAYAPERTNVVAAARYVVLHQEVAWASLDLRADEVEARIVSLSGGVAVPWSAKVRATAEGLRLATSLGEEVELRGRRIVRIDVPDDDLWIEADPGARWPEWAVRGPRPLVYRPPPDAPWTVRPVEIPAAGDAPALAGELLVPPGEGPHPAVLFLSGAGRQDRYGFSGPPPVDARTHVWTDAIARAGFAVLRFDDRGTGASGDGPLDFRAEAEDARRALGALLVAEGVDPDRVAVVGHGEGGWHALFLAREDPAIRAVVLVGTPGRRYDRIVLHQARTTLAQLPPAVRRQALAELEASLTRLREGAPEAAGVDGEEAAYLRQIVAVDPARLFRGVCARVLVVQGGADFEVDPSLDPSTLVDAARAANVPVFRADVPGADHHLVEVDGASTPERYLDPDRPVHRPALARIADFLRDALGATGPRGGCRGAHGAG